MTSSSPPPSSPSTRPVPVAILGATGTVGQRMVQLLDGHPWFSVVALAASPRSAGRGYREAAAWTLGGEVPEAVAGLTVVTPDPDALARAAGGTLPPLVLSALDASVAGPVESELAAAGALVVSNARSHRMDPSVPLVVPEVNPQHLALLDGRPGPGGIITNPNCSTIGLVLALAPLHRRWGVESVHVATLQALSGAGLPGVPAMEIMDNVIPFIGGEEEKLETETLKILGELSGGGIVPAPFRISAQCSRVPVTDGHLEFVSVGLAGDPTPQEVARELAGFRSPLVGGADGEGEPGLPSAPEYPIRVLEASDAPQPRKHRDLGGGMTVSVGRIRPCPLLTVRMAVLSHNTVRGAAGGALLCAELALREGRLAGAGVEA
ncbi:MAG: aspartate-semialdehyde dehydrogenase [Gemmatimonadales bacterium]|nr:MAG: aspartate-semialdehyde dehydrogenase [Gemmatimonadales bacterium]